MTSVATQLLDLVLPRRCLGCAAPGTGLCDRCAGSDEPLVTMQGPVRTYAAGRYAGALRAALVRYKERDRRDLAGPLASLLARAVLGLVRDPAARSVLGSARQGAGSVRRTAVLVTVPSTRSAVSRRGGDHVLRLARRAGVLAGVPVAPGTLAVTRAVRDSAGLDLRERAENLAGAMAARPAPPGWEAILVDDIVTSGATLREAHRALRAAGWRVLGAAVVAATPRHAPASRAERGSRPPGRTHIGESGSPLAAHGQAV